MHAKMGVRAPLSTSEQIAKLNRERKETEPRRADLDRKHVVGTSARSSSTGPPWGVRQLWPNGQFRWHRVASEADGRRLAAQLRGDGATVDVLRMGGGRPW
jgi:hypothetical protein